MAIKRAEMMVFARDFEATVAQYRDDLGFELVSKEDWGFAIFRLGEFHLGILERSQWSQEGCGPEELPTPCLSLLVDDLDIEAARLRAAGVEVGEISGQPGGLRSFDARDREGNWLFYWQT